MKQFLIDICENYKKYVLVFLTILVSDDTFWFGTSGLSGLMYVKYFFLVILALVFAKKINKRDTSILVVVIIMILVSSFLANLSISGGPIMLAVTLLASFGIAKTLTFHCFCKIYCNVILFTALYSCFIWLSIMLGMISPSQYTNIAGVTVDVYGGCVFYHDSFGLLFRNAAFFREPGVFTVLLCIAFIIDSFCMQSLKFKRIVIYVIGIFSTLSTAGVIILAITYVIYVLTHAKSLKSIFLPLILGLGIASLVYTTEELYGDLFSKLERGVEGSESTLGRTSSVTIPLEIIAHNPLFGCGIDDFRKEYIHYGRQLYNREVDPEGLSTNTVLNGMAIFGIWYGLFLLWGLFLFVKQFNNSRLVTFSLLFCILLCFSNESMLYSMALYVLVANGIVWRPKTVMLNNHKYPKKLKETP